MFSIEASPQFDESYSAIMRDVYYFHGKDALSGFEASFELGLTNVATMPEAYRSTPKGSRRFLFSFKAIPYTVFYTFEHDVVTLHDIDYARSQFVARCLGYSDWS